LKDFNRLRGSKEIDVLSTLTIGKRLRMRLYNRDGRIILKAENSTYKDIDGELHIW
jgi:hypothetical protein